MKTLSNYVLSILLILSFSACQGDEETCPAFDFSIPTPQWFLFPEEVNTHIFSNEAGETVAFEKVTYQYNGQHTTSNDGLINSCNLFLKASYQSKDLDITIENELNPDRKSLFENADMSIQSENSNNIYLSLAYDFDTGEIEVFEDGGTLFTAYAPRPLDAVELHGQTFEDVVELISLFPETTRIDRYWIQAHTGLIGINVNGETWVKSN